MLVEIVSKYFSANRVGIYLYNKKTGTFIFGGENAEYLSDPEQTSFNQINTTNSQLFLQPLLDEKEIIFTDLENYAKEHKLEDTEIFKNLKAAKINSSYKIPIFYDNEIKGYFCIDFNETNIKISPVELNFMRTLADQLGIAISQTELYEKELNHLEKDC